jgi:hypothetical protein
MVSVDSELGLPLALMGRGAAMIKFLLEIPLKNLKKSEK